MIGKYKYEYNFDVSRVFDLKYVTTTFILNFLLITNIVDKYQDIRCQICTKLKNHKHKIFANWKTNWSFVTKKYFAVTLPFLIKLNLVFKE